jgi:phosphoglycolate phosphatase
MQVPKVPGGTDYADTGQMNLLFDLDGTLIDSRAGIILAMRFALQQIGRTAPADAVLERFIGPPTQDTFNALVGADDVGLVAEAIRLYRVQYSERGLFDATVYPGIVPPLSAFQSRGWHLYVATSKPVVFAARIAEHFGLTRYFRGIFGSEFDGTRSDKTELLHYIVLTERLEPTRTVMIGDREHDIRGARANSLYSIGALWGCGTRDELVAAGADALCDAPANLPRELRFQSVDGTP